MLFIYKMHRNPLGPDIKVPIVFQKKINNKTGNKASRTHTAQLKLDKVQA
jgi:hypothetical protein